MARKVFLLLKYLLLILLIYAKFSCADWAANFIKWGEAAFSIARPDPEKALGFFHIILNFCILLLGLNLVKITAYSFYRRRQNLPPNKPDNVMVGIENIYILVMSMIVLITILSFFGIDVKSLFTGLTIVAAAIAIITKDYIANIISGIAISFSDEISIGDYVKIGEGKGKGKVTDIGISRISILNDEDDIVFIPNNTVFISEIINYTKKGIRRVSIDFEINHPSLGTMEELEANLISCLTDYHDSIEKDSFKLKIVTIEKDCLSLKFQYTLKSINRELEREIRRKTVRGVVNHIGSRSLGS